MTIKKLYTHIYGKGSHSEMTGEFACYSLAQRLIHQIIDDYPDGMNLPALKTNLVVLEQITNVLALKYFDTIGDTRSYDEMLEAINSLPVNLHKIFTEKNVLAGLPDNFREGTKEQ